MFVFLFVMLRSVGHYSASTLSPYRELNFPSDVIFFIIKGLPQAKYVVNCVVNGDLYKLSCFSLLKIWKYTLGDCYYGGRLPDNTNNFLNHFWWIKIKFGEIFTTTTYS